LAGERDTFFFFEGEKLVKDILAKGVKISKLVVLSQHEDRVMAYKHLCDEIWLVSEPVLNKLSTLKETPAYLAVVDVGRYKINFSKADIVIVLDNVQDPANAGSVFRCASAFGIDYIALTGSSVKPENPKFLRAAQTSVFDIKFQTFPDLDTLLKKSELHTFNVYLTSSSSSVKTIPIKKASAPCLIVIGNEGRGVAPELFEKYPAIRLSQTKRIDSLNAGVSACIIMYELRRLGL
jgi:TrmH family RNA methyltransferase